MKKNNLICFIATVVLGASVLTGCPDNNSASSTAATTTEAATVPTISLSTSTESMTVKLEKFGISEDTVSKFVEKANGEFKPGDVIDLSGIELKDDEKEGFQKLINTVFALTASYDEASMKVSVEQDVTTDLALSDGALKLKITTRD